MTCFLNMALMDMFGHLMLAHTHTNTRKEVSNRMRLRNRKNVNIYAQAGFEIVTLYESGTEWLC